MAMGPFFFWEMRIGNEGSFSSGINLRVLFPRTNGETYVVTFCKSGQTAGLQADLCDSGE